MNQLIINALKTLNIPISFAKYTGTDTTYLIFKVILEQGEKFSNDEEESTGYYIQLNLFSKSDYSSLVSQIKMLMKSANFKRLSDYDADFEADTGYFNHVFRFFYLQEN